MPRSNEAPGLFTGSVRAKKKQKKKQENLHVMHLLNILNLYGCRKAHGRRLSIKNFHTRASYDYVPIEDPWGVLRGPCMAHTVPVQVK